MVDATTGGRRRPKLFSHAVRRHWLTITVVTLLVTLIAAAVGLTRSKTYTATSTVFIRPLVGNSFTSDSFSNSQVVTVALQTEANMVDSVAVTERVNAALHTDLSPGSSVVTAAVPVDTQLVLITATGNTAAQAERYAQAYATGYLAYRQALATANQQAQLTTLNTQADTAQRRLQSAAVAAHEKRPPPDAAAQLQLASTQLSAIQSAIGQAQSIDTDPGSIVKPAHVVPAGLLSSAAVIIVIGAVAGLLIGLLLALWREFRDDRVRASDDTAIEDVPLLGVVTARSARDETEGAAQPTVRRARSAVLAALPERAVLALAPVSHDEGEVANRLAIDLAESVSAAGYRVVLVDANIDHPQVAELLEIGDATGISDALRASDADLDPVRVGALRVLPAGTRPRELRERYGGEQFAAVLRRLQADADFVVVVTAAADTSDGAAVLRSTPHVALVGSDGRTARGRVADADGLARQLGCEVLGVLLVQPARRRKRGSGAEDADSRKQTGNRAEKAVAKDDTVAQGADDEAPAASLDPDSADDDELIPGDDEAIEHGPALPSSRR